MNVLPIPLPIRPDNNNLARIDPDEPIYETGIYRNLWERKPFGDDDVERRSGCCVFNEVDYPNIADYQHEVLGQI